MAWAAQRLPSPPMRICIVTWEYPPLVVGGIAPHVYGIATALAADGHEVVVLTRHHPDATEDSRHNGVRVLRAHVDLPWVPGENLVAQVCSANHKITQLAARLPQRWRPDVVHAHDWLVAWTADSLAALWKRPLVATIHATERGRHQGSITNTMSETINATEWWLSYQARRVITCSAFMRDEVLGAFSLPLDKLDVIANGVDPAVWAPGPGAVRTTDHPLIVTWGRLQYEKGFQHVIEAAVQLRGRFPTLEVVIAGRGSYAEDLARLAVSLGVSDIVRRLVAPLRRRSHPIAVRAVRHRRPRGHGRRRALSGVDHRRPGRDPDRFRCRGALRAGRRCRSQRRAGNDAEPRRPRREAPPARQRARAGAIQLGPHRHPHPAGVRSRHRRDMSTLPPDDTVTALVSPR
jgi:glycosyltransferase involved in cell wall biosynthesis